ncbi:cellulase family glycosylhydrolase [Angustibacter aerolatus]
MVAAIALLSGCGTSAGDFVSRSGSGFVRDGQPFRFVGFNYFDAAASDIYSCAPQARLSDDDLTALLRTAHDTAGATVLRFWAYQPYTDGGRDFTGIDRVLTAAKKADMLVIPVLEDGPGYCTTGETGMSKAEYMDDQWYTTGYREKFGSARLSYRDYAKVLTEHYADDPTILAWMMVNEAETSRRVDGDRTALLPFAQDVASVIRSVDTHHLLTLGTQSNGAPGTSGPDFAALYGDPSSDFAEVHDWAYYGADDQALPGSQDGRLPDPASGQCQQRSARIACSFAIAQQLGKPLVVGEAGIKATDDAGRTRRAEQLGAKADADFAAGADGYLVWNLNTVQTEGYDVVPATRDPLLARLLGISRRLQPPAR